ncbi:hypothetical protein GCM10007304_08120 [Rhodococcoides trifolii]|uniref:Uncharacterized protein n=1 Tax=Rhodococcoides trifolii TaxID=908250 RepID=A0A917FNX3_9NOCA|nr:hypothetical protein GCM10007304_08120 [Rhodococcus trifolii]
MLLIEFCAPWLRRGDPHPRPTYLRKALIERAFPDPGGTRDEVGVSSQRRAGADSRAATTSVPEYTEIGSGKCIRMYSTGIISHTANG